MKKSRTLTLDKDHKIRIVFKQGNGNYTQGVHVYNKNEILPIFGTVFKDTDTNETIKKWANEFLAEFKKHSKIYKIK